jgi:beta-galactosidase
MKVLIAHRDREVTMAKGLSFWGVIFSLLVFGYPLPLLAKSKAAPPPIAKSAPSPRQITPLDDAGWRFQFGDADAGVTTAGFNDSGWEQVSVPHTWNRIGEYALTRGPATNNKQRVGYYRLIFNAPAAAKNRRQYLDFGAVAIIADVWVNGVHVGQHKGGYSRFRFDVTTAWRSGAANVIVVKADNSKPAVGSSTEHVLLLAGDFFQHGGMYRGVSLIEANDVGIDLLDFGGPGVYVDAKWNEDAPIILHGPTLAGEEDSNVDVKVRLRNSSPGRRKISGLVSVRDADGQLMASKPFNKSIALETGAAGNAAIHIAINGPMRLWRDNESQLYSSSRNLHSITVDVFDGRMLVDSVTQKFGLRNFKFDPSTGFSLNGKPLKLKGVSRHQDRLGKGYALTAADHAEDMAIIKEMGANSVRHAHYQHADEWSDEADKAGMIVWAEVPYVTTPSLSNGEGSAEVFANAEQQMRELIRQNYNHPSIVMWSIGNEVDASKLFGLTSGETKPLALLRHLQKVAKEEDPSRPTIFADCCEDVRTPIAGLTAQKQGEKLAGAADMIGYNRYYGWYYPEPLKAAEQLGAQLDKFHATHPTLPISISEYGAGGAVNQFTDNPTSGFVNATGRPQPEDYESWVHEQSWPVIRDRPFVFGSWVWNMFDFASDLRNEGDSVDINTKGLVTFDRKTKKDAFYFYKANWSKEYFIHITGTRYVDRAYPVMDVRAYTTEKRAQLRVGNKDYPEIDCPNHVCVWPNVALSPGPNVMTVSYGELGDRATFNGPDPAKGIRINAGDIAVQMVGGQRFGSDNFVTGGTAAILNQGGFGGRGAPKRTVAATYPELYDHWREGEAFSYAIPVPNGEWTVTVHSFDPGTSGTDTATMRVTANGKEAIPPLNISKAAGGPLSSIAGSFPVTVKNGVLKLDFAGQGGKAVVAAIEITPRLSDRK